MRLGTILNHCLDFGVHYKTRSFLSDHPSEVAILKFSHIRDYSGHDPAATKEKINALLNHYADILYVNSDPDFNLAHLLLGEQVRGKMVLVFDYNDYISPSTGRFRYRDSPTTKPNANLLVFDHYSETPDYQTMQANQIEKWDANAGLGQDFLFLLSWTLTPQFGSPSVEVLAKQANGHLPEVMYQQIHVQRQGKPNIVFIDYVAAESASVAILYNFGDFDG